MRDAYPHTKGDGVRSGAYPGNMGRGKSIRTATAHAARPRTTDSQSHDSDDPFAAATGDVAARAARQPHWSEPNDLIVLSAEQFQRDHGIDRALGAHLLKTSGSYRSKLAYLNPAKSNVVSPERTVAGMTDAGALLSDTINAGDKIAVFADYDPDGTTGAEAFRLGIAPYMSSPCARCAGSPAPDCPDCGGTGDVFRNEQFMVGYADAQRGFGLTDDFVHEAHAAGAKVLVTLDCGSTQTHQVALAQKLGMKVIVADHHNVDPDNPADFHLNPRLYEGEGPISPNTGAQLAWKLAAAVQISQDGSTRPEHWGRAMYLAGFGCRADMGSSTDIEHRAFYRVPMAGERENLLPPGVKALSERLGEDPYTPAGGVLTSACMNLAKRTHLVSAADVGALLACRTEAEAAPLVDKLCDAYDRARPWRQRMVAEAREQVADVAEGDRLAKVILDSEPEFRDYCGYTGSVASDAARACGKPVVCFAPKDTDPHGRTVYKFSMRTGGRMPQKIGDLIEDEGMRAACTLERINEAGQVERSPSIGGHADVVSGSCYEEDIDMVMDAATRWAGSFSASKWFPRPWSGPEASLQERRVPRERIGRLEEQATMLAPFSSIDHNNKPKVSVMGTVTGLLPDEERPDAYMTGILDLGEGETRPIVVSAERAAELPSGEAEYVIEVGERRPYYLRSWFDGPAPGEELAA